MSVLTYLEVRIIYIMLNRIGIVFCDTYYKSHLVNNR